jgi:hypothetical protein
MLLLSQAIAQPAWKVDQVDVYDFVIAVQPASVSQLGYDFGPHLTEVEYSPCLRSNNCVIPPANITSYAVTESRRNKAHLVDGVKNSDRSLVVWFGPTETFVGFKMFSLVVARYTDPVRFNIQHNRGIYVPGYAIYKNGIERYRDTANAGLEMGYYEKIIDIAADPPSTVDLTTSCSVRSNGNETVATVTLGELPEIAPLDWSLCPGLTAAHLSTGPTRIVFQGPGRDSQGVVALLPEGETLFNLTQYPGVKAVELNELTLSLGSSPVPILDVTGSSREMLLHRVALRLSPTEWAHGLLKVGGQASVHVVDSTISAVHGSIRQPVVVASGESQVHVVSSSIEDMSVIPIRLTDIARLQLAHSTINGCEARTSHLCGTLPMIHQQTTA